MNNDWFEILIIAIVLGLLGFLAYVVYYNAQQPTFTLQKSVWTCTKTHNVSSMMLVGKVMIPMTNVECIEYKRK